MALVKQTLTVFLLIIICGPVLSQHRSPTLNLDNWTPPEKPRLKDVSRAFEMIFAQIKGQKSHKKLTRAWRKSGVKRILFLSFSDGTSPAKTLTGTGNSYAEALSDIASIIEERAILKKSKYLKLSILAEVEKPHQLMDRARGVDLEYGLEGVLDTKGKWFVLPGEWVAQQAWDQGSVRIDNLAAAIRVGGRGNPGITTEYQQSGLAVSTFKTFDYYADGTNVYPLFRDHRLFNTITQAELERSMAQGINYLVANTQPKGKMNYVKLKKGSPQYSLARHGGTLFSMADYYKDYPNPELLSAIERAQAYLLEQAKPFPYSKVKGRVLVERGAIKLTVMALGVLALVRTYEIQQHPETLKVLREFAHYIVESQLPNGRFFDRRNHSDGKWRKEMESLYAPGEAIFALTELYGVDPNPLWLETAQKGAAYLMEQQSPKAVPLERLEHDHWLLYGLNAIYRHAPKDAYYAHAMRLTTAIQKLQRKTHQYPDWIGSYYDPPRSTPTATRVEGLLAALEMAFKKGEKQDQKRILEIAKRSLGFQLGTQYDHASSMHFPYPHQIVGGFRGGYDDNHIRIDFVQHNIAAMLSMVRLQKQFGFR